VFFCVARKVVKWANWLDSAPCKVGENLVRGCGGGTKVGHFEFGSHIFSPSLTGATLLRFDPIDFIFGRCEAKAFGVEGCRMVAVAWRQTKAILLSRWSYACQESPLWILHPAPFERPDVQQHNQLLSVSLWKRDEEEEKDSPLVHERLLFSLPG